MVRSNVIVLILFVLTVVFKVQAKTTEFTDVQLFSLQKSSIERIRGLLANEGWIQDLNASNQTREFFGYFLDYRTEKWVDNHTSGWEGDLVVYRKDGTPNLIVYHTTGVRFKKFLGAGTLMSREKDFVRSVLLRQDGIAMELRESDSEDVSQKYTVLIYDRASVDNLVALEKARTEHYDRAMAAATDYVARGQFNEAIDQFNLARKNVLPWDADALDEIDSKTKFCVISNVKISFDRFLQHGDSLFNLEKLEEALIQYKSAQKILPEDSSILGRIEKTVNFLNINEFRGKEQSYSYINPGGFKQYSDTCYSAMNNLMLHAGSQGRLNFSSVIQLDNQGTNLSKNEIVYTSNPDLRSYLKGISLKDIPPARVLNYFIPVREELNFNLSWKTSLVNVFVVAQKMEINNSEFSTRKYNDKIKHFVNEQSYKNGVYRFEVVGKKLNNTNFEDLKLVSFRTNSGPMNCLYSMILPGWGTLKVTDGKKGTGRMISFLASTAFSIGCKIFSNNQFGKYRNGEDHNERYYKKADVANKLFLVSGGISAAIYLGDIFSVVRRGIKNNLLSQPLRDELYNGPVYVVKSSLKP